MTQLNKNFQKKYPNIKINRVAKSFTDLQATLKLAASGPNPPDVIEVNNGYSSMGPLVKAGLLLNLNKYAGKYGWNDALLDRAPEDEQVHLRRATASAIGQPLRPADDRRGRRRLLQQGQAEEARAEDADDVPAVRRRRSSKAQDGGRDADPVRQPRQVAGHPRRSRRSCSRTSRSTWASDWIFGARGGKINFTSQGTLNAATKLQSWAKAGNFTKGYEGLGYDPSWADFGKGKGVFLISGSWLTADLKKALGKNLGFFLLPPPSGKPLATLGGEGLPWAISSKTKNADAAATYLDFITNNASMQVVTDNGNLSATKAKVKVPSGIDTEVFNAWNEGELDGRDRPLPRLGDADDVRHDHGRDPGAAGGQGHAAGLREQGQLRLLEVP